jgi:hypothetical protein
VALFKEHRDKGFTTLLGEVRLEVRPYYHCGHCHHGHFPGDATLGLTGRRMSAGAEQVVTLAGTLTSFGEAATKILPKMAAIRFGESTVERITEGNGARLGQFWEHGRTLGPARDWDWNRDARGQRLAYVSVDATGVGQQGPRGAKAEGKMDVTDRTQLVIGRLILLRRRVRPQDRGNSRENPQEPSASRPTAAKRGQKAAQSAQILSL